MALFNRRNQDKVVLPEEVRDYYQAERRQRTGRAWLLALVTLLITFLIAAALFFGGRWLYRAVFGNDDTNKTTTGQTQNIGDDAATNTGGTDGAENESDEDAPATKVPATPAPAPTTPGTSQQPPASPAPASPPSQLINTGPGDEL